MKPCVVRLIVLSLLIPLLSMCALDLKAQSVKASATAPAQDSDKNDEVSTLDIFDEDAELTRQGWIQFYAAAGFMYLDGDGKASVRMPDGNEISIIDFDRAGLKDTDSSYWLTLNWRSANSRWGAWFGSWEFDAVGSRMWEDSLPIGDTEIPVGASVTSDFEAKWYILEATYSFYRTDTVDTGIGLGVHTVDLDTSVTARFQIGEQESIVTSNRLDTLAPLPNVLVYLHWKFAPRWSLVTRFGYFGLSYKDYSGQMTNAHTMVNFQLSQRWALGLGYQFVDLELDVEKEEFTQVYDMTFSGPMAYFRFSF